MNTMLMVSLIVEQSRSSTQLGNILMSLTQSATRLSKNEMERGLLGFGLRISVECAQLRPCASQMDARP